LVCVSLPESVGPDAACGMPGMECTPAGVEGVPPCVTCVGPTCGPFSPYWQAGLGCPRYCPCQSTGRRRARLSACVDDQPHSTPRPWPSKLRSAAPSEPGLAARRLPRRAACAAFVHARRKSERATLAARGHDVLTLALFEARAAVGPRERFQTATGSILAGLARSSVWPLDQVLGCRESPARIATLRSAANRLPVGRRPCGNCDPRKCLLRAKKKSPRPVALVKKREPTTGSLDTRCPFSRALRIPRSLWVTVPSDCFTERA
jgi:hypothetical protein